MNQPQRAFVIDAFGVHRPHEREPVGDAPGVRQQFAQFDAGTAVLLELERRAEHVALLLVEVHFEVAAGIGLAVIFVQGRLGIEQIHLARAAVLKQADDVLRFGPRHRTGLFRRAAVGSLRGGARQMRQRQSS